MSWYANTLALIATDFSPKFAAEQIMARGASFFAGSSAALCCNA